MDRFDRGYSDGYDKGHNHNRSPDKGSGWGDRSKSLNRDRSRSRSPDRYDRAPAVRSFHQAMMEKGRASPSNQIQHERSRSPCAAAVGGSSFHKAVMERGRSQCRGSGGSFHKEMMEQGRSSSYHAQQERGRSLRSGGINAGPRSGHEGRGFNAGPHSYFGEEEEEGMIPADERCQDATG